MRPIRLEPIKREEVYGNWKMLSPEGVLMCRLSEKKANWYLSRDLADLVDEKTLQLKFSPNGVGDTNEYMLEDKESQCVVCGARHELTFHHVVPHGYRKHFPLAWKSHSSHDNLLLCERCHHTYERAAWDLKKTLQYVYAPISPSAKAEKIQRSRAVRAAYALVRESTRHRIPTDKKVELYALVEPYVPDLEDATLEAFVKDAKKNPDRQDPIVDCERVAKAVIAKGDDEMRAFIERWRRHFLETTFPQYLSENWSIDWHKDIEEPA